MPRMLLGAFVVALALPLGAQQIVDSPLVALAKRTGRLGKIPAHVITNEEVASARGRISWGSEAETPATTGTSPAAASPWAAADAAYAARLAKERAMPAPQSLRIEGSTRATYSMPVSTAQNATVTSSVITTMPLSTAQNATINSTASSRMLDSTARNANPSVVVPKPVN